MVLISMRIALKFAYNGIPFYGYARQPGLQTVEGELIKVLKKNKFIDSIKKAMVKSASRTDKGVSAFGNVIAFDTKKNAENIIQECNDLLDHIVLYGMNIVDDQFYPRHAKKRIYHYYLTKDEVTLQTIESLIPLFIGSHDFSNFARVEPQKNQMRTIEKITVKETDSYVVLEFQAQTYLWQQIRRIVSSIQKCEKKKISKDEIGMALKYPMKQVDFGLADPYRLILNDIIYDFYFDIDTNGLKKKKALEQEIIKKLRHPCF
ncbi:MAG: tRNA pseudouridine(38-40) synthase TruA [Candidatus Thermoplasmatota archaeon]|nr:tRNA pseudouridine(38-40) synthase TruA [Candidatus Thermoplasmatota archaeon]